MSPITLPSQVTCFISSSRHRECNPPQTVEPSQYLSDCQSDSQEGSRLFDTLLSTEHLEVEEEFDRLHELSMNEDNQTEDVPHSVFGNQEDKSKILNKELVDKINPVYFDPDQTDELILNDKDDDGIFRGVKSMVSLKQSSETALPSVPVIPMNENNFSKCVKYEFKASPSQEKEMQSQLMNQPKVMPPLSNLPNQSI